MLGSFVGAIGVHHILGARGMLNAILLKMGIIDSIHLIDWLGKYKLIGMYVLNAVSLYPILDLNLVSMLANIDLALNRTTGCHGLKRFVQITLQLTQSGILAEVTLVSFWSLTELRVPLMFDEKLVVSVPIYHGSKKINDNQLLFALVGIVLLLSLAFYIWQTINGTAKLYNDGKSLPCFFGRKIVFFKKLRSCCLFMGVALAAVMPHIAVILTSFAGDWYNSISPNVWTLDNCRITLGHLFTIPSIQNGVIYSSCSTLVPVVLGIMVAFVVVRSHLKLRHLLDTMTMLLLAVLCLVMAFRCYSTSQKGRAFAFINPIENPTLLLIIAYAVRKLPFIVRSSISGLQQMGYTYEETAQCLGCSPIKIQKL
jgi:iron(III) transport system permease protein